jgi:hypothetical protein
LTYRTSQITFTTTRGSGDKKIMVMPDKITGGQTGGQRRHMTFLQRINFC